MSFVNTMTSKTGFVYNRLVIGNSLRAIEYCLTNCLPLLFNKTSRDYMEEVVDPISFVRRQEGLFQMALSGSLIYMPDLQIIRDKHPQLALIGSTSKIIYVDYNKLIVFEDDKLESVDLIRNVLDDVLVCDLFSLRNVPLALKIFEVGGIPCLTVHPYLSKRIDGNTAYEDLMSTTSVPRTALSSFEYTDTANKFRIRQYLRENGFPKVKIETLNRDVFPITQFKIMDTERIIDGRDA